MQALIDKLVALFRSAIRTRVTQFPLTDSGWRRILPAQENRVGYLLEYYGGVAPVSNVFFYIGENPPSQPGGVPYSFRFMNDGDSYTADPIGRECTAALWLIGVKTDAFISVTVFER